MAVFLLTYDLNNEVNGQDYKPLYKELAAWGAFRILKSVWLVASDQSAAWLFSHFSQYLDPDDLLWIDRQRDGEFHYRAMDGTHAWLEDNPAY